MYNVGKRTAILIINTDRKNSGTVNPLIRSVCTGTHTHTRNAHTHTHAHAHAHAHGYCALI
jgi:hypothetical protein